LPDAGFSDLLRRTRGDRRAGRARRDRSTHESRARLDGRVRYRWLAPPERGESLTGPTRSTMTDR
jgi:hypothetical protein